MSEEPEFTEDELMDISVAAIDDKINKKRVVISNLESDVNKLEIKLHRHRRDLRRLGARRAEAETFQLKL